MSEHLTKKKHKKGSKMPFGKKPTEKKSFSLFGKKKATPNLGPMTSMDGEEM